MKFRKDSILLAECEIYTLLLGVLCISLIDIFSWCFWFAVVLLILMVIYPFALNEYILISESGICCMKRTDTLWAFSWEEISELRKSRRFRQNSIDIIPLNAREYNLQVYYFQLGPTAKAALQKYSP